MGQHVRGLYLRNEIYWMTYVDNNGRRHRETTGVKDRKEAEKYLRKKQTEIAEDRYLDKKKDQRIKFEDFAEKYLEKYSMVNNRAWKKSDWVQIRSLKKHFSGYCLSEITKDVIDDFRAKKKKEGGKNGGINRVLACLKSMYNRAIEWGDFDGQILHLPWISMPDQDICSQRDASYLRLLPRIAAVIPERPSPADLDRIFTANPALFTCLGYYWQD